MSDDKTKLMHEVLRAVGRALDRQLARGQAKDAAGIAHEKPSPEMTAVMEVLMEIRQVQEKHGIPDPTPAEHEQLNAEYEKSKISKEN